jgi:mannitol/fructose-specific phosphotransferase system IIA component (Ntr-type)
MLKEVLTKDVVTIDLQGKDKREVIVSLLKLLERSGKLHDFDTALQDILSHEAGMSTGMEHGIAIPHAKSEAVKELTAAVGISKRKINFESLDRKPAQIFIMTLSPPSAGGPHIQFLAEIGRLLQDRKRRKAMLKAGSDEELMTILTS